MLGRVGAPPGAKDGHLRFAIRPAGDPSTIDPRAILANWAQLDAALHPQGAKGNPSLLGATASDVFLLSKSRLEREVLSDPGIALSACSRHEVASGAIDKRALAVLAFLSRSGLKPTVGTLRCGAYAAAGYVAAGHAGDAVAIVAINGVPIAGHQGAGSITDTTIRTLLTLQGEFTPARIVSLMRYPGAPNTLARADHGDYIEIVFAPAPRRVRPEVHRDGRRRSSRPAPASAPAPVAIVGELSAAQWEQLIARIAALPAPSVAVKPSSAAIPDHTTSPGPGLPGRARQSRPGARVTRLRPVGLDLSRAGATAGAGARPRGGLPPGVHGPREARRRRSPLHLTLGRLELWAGRVDAFGVEDRAFARRVRRRARSRRFRACTWRTSPAPL